jgi:hypothetical protein
VLPPSVLFWGRRVYWAPVVLLVTALRQGCNPDATLEKLKALCGVWRSTVKRWQRYFRELFPSSATWRRLSGRLIPPIAVDDLPRALLVRFYRACGQAEAALVQCLQVFARGP